MKLGSLKSTDRQEFLFEVEHLLGGEGATRSWVGDFFEELLANLTGARRIKSDSTAEICPDHQFSARLFLECKGVGQSGQGIMYRGRYEKDQRFIETGAEMLYCFWRHKFPVMKAYTIQDLRAGLAGSTISLSLITRADLDRLIATRPLRPINSKYNQTGKRNGYGDEKLYGSGWVFPISHVTRMCCWRSLAWGVAYGQAAAFTLHASFDCRELIRRHHGASLLYSASCTEKHPAGPPGSDRTGKPARRASRVS